jgi:hypothetical protein
MSLQAREQSEKVVFRTSEASNFLDMEKAHIHPLLAD